MAISEKNKTEKTEKMDVFDVQRIRRLVELMQDNDLTEIDLQQGDMRIQMKKDSQAAFVSSGLPQQVDPAYLSPASPVPPAVPAQAAAPVVVEDESRFAYIKSPMVGTFFASSNPQSPSFVKVGDVVYPEKTVCILEAMKVFNEIQAEMSGKIVAVLVSNGEPVEYGKPLFKIDIRAS